MSSYRKGCARFPSDCVLEKNSLLLFVVFFFVFFIYFVCLFARRYPTACFLQLFLHSQFPRFFLLLPDSLSVCLSFSLVCLSFVSFFSLCGYLMSRSEIWEAPYKESSVVWDLRIS